MEVEMAKSGLQMLLDSFKAVLSEKKVKRPKSRFRSYAITNFRGGIGKSTLAFNLAYEVSRDRKTLLVDVCPQRNFSQALLGETLAEHQTTIYDALLPSVSPGTESVALDDLLVSVPPECRSFKHGAGAYSIPGSKELFLFPSLLYTTLSNTANIGSDRAKSAKRVTLTSLSRLIESAMTEKKFDITLIDTSPFFGGATHLAWIAAEALIIPVRVDQHSIEALRLTLSMLRNRQMDFLRLNQEAGIERIPKVHAIVMTHCGWNRQEQNTPDHSTQSYLEQVLSITDEYHELFTSENPIDCIHLLDDFHSAGRISGTERIPLAKLEVGKFHRIEGQRVQVNQSLDRYNKEIKELSMTI
jgi:chromosome partitioning protein